MLLFSVVVLLWGVRVGNSDLRFHRRFATNVRDVYHMAFSDDRYGMRTPGSVVVSRLGVRG